MRTRVVLVDTSAIARLARFSASTPAKLQALLREYGREARNAIIRRIRESKPAGREYPRGRKVHVASAPGQPPARDSGDLISHIFYEVGRTPGVGFHVDVGTTMTYGEALEFGTSRMAARPWLLPGINETTDALRDALVRRYGDL